jgi:hypothetical protein
MIKVQFAKGGYVRPNYALLSLTHKLDRAATVDLFCPVPITTPEDPIIFAEIEIAVDFIPRLMRKPQIACARFMIKPTGEHPDWAEVVEDDKDCSNLLLKLTTPQPIDS